MADAVTTRTSQETVGTTGHTVLLPDGSDVTGLRVGVIFAVNSQTAIIWPLGWTEFFNGTTTDTRLAAAYRDIDGTEGFDGTDDSITVTTVASEQSNHHSYQIDGHDASTSPESATAVTGNGNTPDPPSLNPSGWDAEETLWIAVAAFRFDAIFQDAPTNYTNLLALGGGDANAPLGSARRILNAASEDPGTFTCLGELQWVATTLAVRLRAAGATELDGTNTAQAQTATAAALTQTHELSADSTVQAQSATAAALTQVHELQPTSAVQGQSATAAALTQLHELVATSAVQAQVVDLPALILGELPESIVTAQGTHSLIATAAGTFQLVATASGTHDLIVEAEGAL